MYMKIYTVVVHGEQQGRLSACHCVRAGRKATKRTLCAQLPSRRAATLDALRAVSFAQSDEIKRSARNCLRSGNESGALRAKAFAQSEKAGPPL